MITLRLHPKRAGAHVHTTVFIGQCEASLGFSGTLSMREDEYEAFRIALHLGEDIDNFRVEEVREQACGVTEMKYTATSVTKTCGACPSQWDILALPKPLYARYRFGTLSVQIDEGDSLGDEIFHLGTGDPLDGVMETEDMMNHTSSVIDWERVCHYAEEGSKPPESE